ncbi:MFS general substrate transporter [Artomyces pyxidatus]|uniref:MFS general substrate transporter n=1 Tax=Artomyces pyxidatus TaxID=48021 RepID=A0ACB8SQG9_9AGAM|nr:MFS general substrate transporter [Artomyces pyxidatus]
MEKPDQNREGSVKGLENQPSSPDLLSSYPVLLDSRRRHAERQLVRKIDSRLMPPIIIICIMNYIDRTAVTAARLKGLEQDLGLDDIQYNIVLAVLYVSYFPAQIVSNMILNRIARPSVYIGVCVVLWGLISTLSGVTHNFSGFVACRVFIGLPEAAFYPGMTYLLSRWYTRKELGFRGAMLYSGVLIANAFGSLMAAGILSHLDGTLGIRAWRWFVIIPIHLGSVTMILGFVTIYLLPDFPHNTRWLSSAEKHLAQVRISEDAGEADEDTATDTPWSGFMLAVKDPKVSVMAVMACSLALGLSFANFFPTLTETLGFGTTISLLLAAPPWLLATALCFLNAWLADKTGERFFHIAVPWWGTIVGYIIGVTTVSIKARYFAMFLMTCGAIGIALILVWVSNVIPRPPAKRAAAIGIVNGFGNIGSLIGSFTWKAAWGPEYHISMYINIGALVLTSSLALLLRIMLIRQNNLLDSAGIDDSDATRVRVEDAARLEGISIQEAVERRRGFRYLY